MGDIGQQTAVAFDDVVKREEQTLGAVVALGAELAGPLDALVESVFHIFHTVCNYQLMGVRPRETR